MKRFKVFIAGLFLAVCLGGHAYGYDIYDGGTEVYPDRVEFICPADGTKSIYKKSDAIRDYDYLRVIKDFDYSLEQLNEFGADYGGFFYDQTPFCKVCSPKLTERCFYLIIKKIDGTAVKNKLDYHHNVTVYNANKNPVRDRMEYIDRLLVKLIMFLDRYSGYNKEGGTVEPLHSSDPAVIFFLGIETDY